LEVSFLQAKKMNTIAKKIRGFFILFNFWGIANIEKALDFNN